MKKFNFIKRLLLVLMVLMTCSPQMWAYYFPGTIKAERWSVTDNNMGGDGKITFYAVPPGTYYGKLTNGSTWYNGAWTQESGGDGLTINYKSSDQSIELVLTQERDIYVEVKADNKVLIKSLPASYRIYYNWAVSGKGWSDWLVSNGDGTYSCHGRYNEYTSNYYYRMFSSDDDTSTEGTTISYTGSPAHEDYCIFTYNSSTNALNIRKASTVTPTNYFYFDNTNAQWNENYTYFVMGTPGRSTMYGTMSNITNTQLKYSNNGTDSWTDVSYYAIAAGSEAWGGGNDWNYPALTGWEKRSAPNFTQLDLQNGYLYVIGKENGTNDEAITVTEQGDEYADLNFSLGYKYVLYDPSSSSWVDMTSSHGNTPAQISLTSYKFNSVSTVTANTTQTISENTNTTYTKSVTDCAYRGNTNLAYSNLSEAYKFIGWYDGSTEKSTSSSYDFYPTGATTLSARFEYRWALMGSMLDQDWKTDNYITHITRNGSGQDVGYIDLVLPGNSNFVFKVVDRAAVSGQWWSCNGETFNIEDDNNVAKTCTHVGTESNMTFNTAAAGTYRFTWNTSTHQLTVTYPASHTITFGAGAINGSSTAITASASPSFSSGQYVLDATSVTFSKGSTNAGYDWAGWYSNNDGTGTLHSSTDGDYTNSSRSANLTVYACYTYHNYTISYYDKGGEDYSGDNLGALPSTHQYNTATVLVNGTKAGYNFEGWYATYKCDGDPITSLGATDYTDNIVLFAKWSPVELLTFNSISDTDWGTPANWTPNCVPTIEHAVSIEKPVVIGSTSAQAKSIDIKSGGSLTISAGKGLVVAGSITADGKATSSSNLTVDAGGALVWGTTGTPGAATVGFANSSYGEGGDDTSINQYIGTPFVGGNTSDYGSAWTYSILYDGSGNPYWNEYKGSMSPFIGYNLISREGTGVFSLSGTLVSNADQEITLSHGVENVLANSWIAPIRIGALQSTDFGGATASIYIFKATSPKALEKESGLFGNYDTYSVGTSSEDIIPSMQSFSVLGTGTLSLDYSKIVYDPAVEGLVTAACRAPRRANSKKDEMIPLRIHVRGTNGWSDELKMYLHEDFSTDYENGWDAPKMYGFEEAPSLYAMNNEGEMAISCVPTADNQFVCFHAGTDDNEYTMTFVYDGDEELYLKDTKLNIDTQINSENSYHFAATTSDSDMRFIIHRAPAVVTGMEEVNTNGNVQKIMHNGALYIVREGKIYSIDGVLVK